MDYTGLGGVPNASSGQGGGGDLSATQSQSQQQPFLGQGVLDFSNQQNYSSQSDVYSTKQYFDYYNSLKPRDPKLPKPTYSSSLDMD
jgi:hypothetical protein